MTHKFSLGVQVVKHHVSVALVARSEDDNLVFLGELSEKIYSKRSDVYSCIYFFACRELDFEGYVMGEAEILIAVDECLI
jgi:hypothetical protein